MLTMRITDHFIVGAKNYSVRKLSEKCNFADKINERLRVVGVRDKKIKQSGY